MFGNYRIKKLEEKFDKIERNLFNLVFYNIKNDKLDSVSNSFYNEFILIGRTSSLTLCHWTCGMPKLVNSYHCTVYGHPLNGKDAEKLWKIATDRIEEKRIEDIEKENNKLKKQLKKKGK